MLIQNNTRILAVITCLAVVVFSTVSSEVDAQASEDSFTQVALTGSLNDLADFSAEIAPLNEVRILDRLSLIYAARNFEPDRLEVIMKSHTSFDIVDDSGTTAVMHALMAGRVENAKLLYERGASLSGVNDRGYTVRVLAEEVGLPDFGPEYPVSFPSPGVDPEDANQLLLLASEAGDTPLIDWALSLGADLSTRADNGLQAAHLAALGGHEETFDHILSHVEAPREWATLRNASTEGQVFTVADFIIAGEGGGDHERAGRMLTRALQIPSLADRMSDYRDRYRDAMMTIGYPLDVVVVHFGAPALPPWDIGLPINSYSQFGGSPDDWRALQRGLARKGLYTGAIDGIPGRGSLRGIVFHTAQNLPTLLERVETMHQVLALDPGILGTEWERLSWDDDRWSLSAPIGLHEGRVAEGRYTLDVPQNLDKNWNLSRVPLGQRYVYYNEDGVKSWFVEFTLGAPDKEYFAHLRMTVFGRQLLAAFYEDRFTYQLQSVTRTYTSTEDVPWIVGLQVD